MYNKCEQVVNMFNSAVLPETSLQALLSCYVRNEDLYIEEWCLIVIRFNTYFNPTIFCKRFIFATFASTTISKINILKYVKLGVFLT